MDAVAGLLDGPRARGAFLLRSTMDPPWSLRIEDEAPLTLVAIVRGEAWIVPDGRDPVRLAAGDVAIVRGPEHYTVADDPATAPQAVILPGQRCTTPDGQEVAQMMDLGVRTWGNAADGATVMLTGTYQLDGEVSRRLLRALPTLLVLPGDAWESPLVGAAGRRDRQGRSRPGGGARPPARPAADRRPARVVRAPRGRRARVVPRLRRPGRRPRAADAAPQPVAPVDGGGAGRRRPACRAPRWRGASTTSSASRR